MLFTFESIIQTINDRLSLLNEFANILFYSEVQRVVDIVAFTTEKEAYVAEYLYRESSWQSANNRSSLMNQSYFINYKPNRKIGASGSLQITADPSFSTSYVYPGNDVFIPKYSIFKSSDGIKNIYNTEETTYYKNTVGNFEIPVREGVPKEFIYTASGLTNERILLSTDSSDNDLIEIFIVDSIGNILNTVSIVDDPFFINELTNYYCTVTNAPDFSSVYVTFGNDIYTRKLVLGEFVLIKYVDTLGDKGNIEGINLISKIENPLKDTNENNVSLYVRNAQTISDGSGFESIDSIRSEGRRNFFAGYRAASKTDWVTLIESFPSVLKAIIWTDVDLGLPAIGFNQNLIYVSAVSTSGDALSSAQETDLVNNYILPKKCPTDVVSFQPLNKIFVKFDITATAKLIPQTQIRTETNTILNNTFGITKIDFNQSIYASNFISTISLNSNIKYHTTVGYYVEENLPFLKYLHKLEASIIAVDEPDATKQITIQDNGLEIWIRRKVTNNWNPPVKIANSRRSPDTIDSMRYIAVVNSTNALVDPTATDDSSGGYAVGDVWKNTVSNEYFEALNVSIAAAVWQNIKASISGIPTVNSDDLLGFTVGSVWYLGNTGNYYECIDDTTGAAVWQIRRNIEGFGNGTTTNVTTFKGYKWNITAPVMNYTTNVISYEVNNIVLNPSSFGVQNPSETDPNGFIIYLIYRMQDGNGSQTNDIRIGKFFQIIDTKDFLNTYAISY